MPSRWGVLLVYVGPPKYLARPFRSRLGLMTSGNSDKQRQKCRVHLGFATGPSPYISTPCPPSCSNQLHKEQHTRMVILDTSIWSTHVQHLSHLSIMCVLLLG